MRRRTRYAGSVMALALLTLWSCGGGDDGGGVFEPDPPTPEPDPVPGFLNVRLTTPNTDDGALMFALAGGPMDSLQASGLRIFATGGGSAFTAIVVGDVAAGTVARFWVPDVADSGLYSASLRQASTRATYQQKALTGYSLTVAR
ncbi:MAG: hypothetical protein RJQ04_15520 [Longimicrobiales bacterium]